MSVKTKLARQAVKTTAKHTAHSTASKLTRRPLRSISLLAIGAAVGFLVGRRIGRSGDDDQLDPIAQAPASPNVADDGTAQTVGTGAVS
ncbi:MAG TPA: hypothetical protein VHV53_04880 [Solirubrobacterales bacterium]|jgi:hypothetical protein|nr:hypothetical protein [Solirubrobacterales bacterium]